MYMPKGEAILRIISEDRWARLGYSAAQGNISSTILRNNLTESSATALWGESSQKLVPELAFHEGNLLSVGKNSGGQPDLARTADIGIAKEPTSPIEWENLTQESFENPVYDMKVSNSYVKNKAGFKIQSGGLDVTEVRPWSKPQRSSPAGPKGLPSADAVVAGVAIAAVQSNNAKEFAVNSAVNIAATRYPPLVAVTAPDEGSALAAVTLGYIMPKNPGLHGDCSCSISNIHG
jgi:hypothetical protein